MFVWIDDVCINLGSWIGLGGGDSFYLKILFEIVLIVIVRFDLKIEIRKEKWCIWNKIK